MAINTYEYKELNDFNNWILSIGNGNAQNNSMSNEDDDPDYHIVEIPDDLLVKSTDNKIKALVDTTFPDFKSNYTNIEYLKSRAILATTNEIVDEINDSCQI